MKFVDCPTSPTQLLQWDWFSWLLLGVMLNIVEEIKWRKAKKEKVLQKELFKTYDPRVKRSAHSSTTSWAHPRSPRPQWLDNVTRKPLTKRRSVYLPKYRPMFLIKKRRREKNTVREKHCWAIPAEFFGSDLLPSFRMPTCQDLSKSKTIPAATFSLFCLANSHLLQN